MSNEILDPQATAEEVCRAVIVSGGRGGVLAAETAPGHQRIELIGALQTGHPAAPLHVGDEVLIWATGTPPRGIVLGRIDPLPDGTVHETPDELIIEAGKSLTLRVGDGSITIREDGKILIKGTDLVSHAKRMNRVRGGSVAIN